uniref:Tudor domain-containing protein n=1 Tax=Panagrolaimus sp. ES5 TaxID=591445 RepID=A0AC34FAH2_9BILA
MKARSPSPFLQNSTDPHSKIPELINDKNKIHRIRCRRNYNAVVTNVVSPSEIWVQILNHIADTLVIPTSDAPPLETELIERKYVMTPINEDILVRARILEVEESKVYLRLIDYGTTVWRDENAIFKMTGKLHLFPWQACVVMLHGVLPKEEDKWSLEETQAIKRALMEFDYVCVQPTPFEFMYYDDDASIPRVSLLGMNGPLQQSIFDVNGSRVSPEIHGMDVASLYHMYSFSTPKYMIDVADQKEYPHDII